MLAGHFATALVAHQRAPARRFHTALLGWYLVVSQLPDLLWLAFHHLGLEPTRPVDLFDVTLQSLSVDMIFSHDLLPIALPGRSASPRDVSRHGRGGRGRVSPALDRT